ncbi:MAG: amidohydrolase family protein [Steroidobacteraceae bacterium]
MYRNSRKAWLAGFQLATHANGERTIDRVLGVYEQLNREFPRRDPRFRIEHCTVLTPELVARMRTVGAIPIPFAGYVNFHGDILHFYADERTARMFAYRSFIDAGLRPPSSSDYTASPIAPGKLAGLAVLAQDPLAVPAESWQGIKVERTMLGGKWVYEA